MVYQWSGNCAMFAGHIKGKIVPVWVSLKIAGFGKSKCKYCRRSSDRFENFLLSLRSFVLILSLKTRCFQENERKCPNLCSEHIGKYVWMLLETISGGPKGYWRPLGNARRVLTAWWEWTHFGKGPKSEDSLGTFGYVMMKNPWYKSCPSIGNKATSTWWHFLSVPSV
jgi:hypothetical protein